MQRVHGLNPENICTWGPPRRTKILSLAALMSSASSRIACKGFVTKLSLCEVRKRLMAALMSSASSPRRLSTMNFDHQCCKRAWWLNDHITNGFSQTTPHHVG